MKCLLSKVGALLVLSPFLTSSAFGATEELREAAVLQVVTGNLYTGCAVRLNKSVSLAECDFPDYVHFDCDGTFGSPSKASNNKFQTAQLALALERTLYINVSERDKDGICMADVVIMMEQ